MWMGNGAGIGLAAAMVVAVSSGVAVALDEPANEREVLKACERSVCEIIVKKPASGPDAACKLSKTWKKDKIKQGVESKKVSWSFGDAQCSVELALSREVIVSALTKPDYTLDFPARTISCKIEREGETTPVNITLAPKVTFKDGKAVKALLGLKDIEAPAVIKGAIWTVATVEDTVGLFHSDIIKVLNEFVDTKCPKALQ